MALNNMEENNKDKKKLFNFWGKKKEAESQDYEKAYKKYESKAKDYMEDKEKAEELLKEAKKKAKDNKGALEEVWDNINLLFEIVQAWSKGTYREIPKGSIIMIIASVLYFVSPVDLIPDFILGLGLIDDAAVIAFAIKQLAADLEKFKIWKEDMNDDTASE